MEKRGTNSVADCRKRPAVGESDEPSGSQPFSELIRYPPPSRNNVPADALRTASNPDFRAVKGCYEVMKSRDCRGSGPESEVAKVRCHPDHEVGAV